MDKPMKTIIKVDKDYKVIDKKVINEKDLPSKILDSIIPILREEAYNNDGAIFEGRNAGIPDNNTKRGR